MGNNFKTLISDHHSTPRPQLAGFTRILKGSIWFSGKWDAERRYGLWGCGVRAVIQYARGAPGHHYPGAPAAFTGLPPASKRVTRRLSLQIACSIMEELNWYFFSFLKRNETFKYVDKYIWLEFELYKSSFWFGGVFFLILIIAASPVLGQSLAWSRYSVVKEWMNEWINEW